MDLHPNNLRTSQVGIDFIKAWEGLRLHWYLDKAGKPTIGYGHLMNHLEQKTLTVITQEQAENLLKSDVRLCEIYINSNIRSKLNQHQFDALVSFAFNLGVGALEHGKSTLRRFLDVGDYAAAAGQFVRWNKVRNPKTGKFRALKGLTNRRLAERAMFLQGAPA
jgi:lysozyme